MSSHASSSSAPPSSINSGEDTHRPLFTDWEGTYRHLGNDPARNDRSCYTGEIALAPETPYGAKSGFLRARCQGGLGRSALSSLSFSLVSDTRQVIPGTSYKLSPPKSNSREDVNAARDTKLVEYIDKLIADGIIKATAREELLRGRPDGSKA